MAHLSSISQNSSRPTPAGASERHLRHVGISVAVKSKGSIAAQIARAARIRIPSPSRVSRLNTCATTRGSSDRVQRGINHSGRYMAGSSSNSSSRLKVCGQQTPRSDEKIVETRSHSSTSRRKMRRQIGRPHRARRVVKVCFGGSRWRRKAATSAMPCTYPRPSAPRRASAVTCASSTSVSSSGVDARYWGPCSRKVRGTSSWITSRSLHSWTCCFR
mmetsp:Transcript_23029/g.57209  ORF Transcript_23029/g.57209 Transcript_23029/m.57209 type:complete len:217 (-) Transcript_23029:413-1063(-)